MRGDIAHYVGRFAPSPTGALHAGSLVAALASWLDARSHGGKWLVRIEDVDTPRCIPGADLEILRQLAACGLIPDEEPVYQSQRSAIYQSALDQLIGAHVAYPCACSRKDIEAALSASGVTKSHHGELIYPGTCRDGLAGRPARAWRFFAEFLKEKQPIAGAESAQDAHFSIASDLQTVHWQDRRLGHQKQNVSLEVGDVVLQRADGLWAYQLAVVVDDAAQGVTHIVRGEDLADNTARQILLQQALAYPTPQYLHTPLVLADDGHKLSKQNGALPLALESESQAIEALHSAANTLELQTKHMCTQNDILMACITQWKRSF
jgi:glutamyl-Q tRNA(Asp) synthetase